MKYDQVDDPFRQMDQDILRMEESLTPTQVQALIIEGLQAELQVANERTFWLVAELAKANAKLHDLNYKTFDL